MDHFEDESTQSSRKSTNEKKTEMAPLFYFLASSLNVELVYIILKSLTQFVNIDPERREFYSQKGKHVTIINDEKSEDVTLELNKIKIKNYSDWSPATGSELF